LSKENLHTECHCRPNIRHLCSNVTEGQIADHQFLLFFGVCQHYEMAGHRCCPRQLQQEPTSVLSDSSSEQAQHRARSSQNKSPTSCDLNIRHVFQLISTLPQHPPKVTEFRQKDAYVVVTEHYSLWLSSCP